MAHSSLITLTEVSQNWRRATLHEKGWRFFNAEQGYPADNCAILWDTRVWHRKDAFARRLSTKRYIRALSGKPGPATWSCNAVLKHIASDRTMLVSLTHMPAHIQGHWKNPGTEQWRARKEAYTDAMTHWSDGVATLERRFKPDAVLVVADWNLNLKDNWVRDYLRGHWLKKCGVRSAWTDFPTSGGSLQGNHIIDGSYYGGMKVTDGPELGDRVRSSDHRPYRESFQITGGWKNGQAAERDDPFYNPATGHIGPGVEWWGFGDYKYDEMFEKVRETEEGTVVTFDFESPPY